MLAQAMRARWGSAIFTLLLLVCPGAGKAGLASSSNYTLDEGAVVTTGGETSSTDLSIDGVAGQSSPVGTTSSPGFTVDSGIISNPPADLVIDSLTASPSPAAVGQDVTITAAVSNVGGATASSFEVALYKNLRTPPGTDQVADVVCPVASIAAGEATTCTGHVIYGSTGTDIIWVQVDPQNGVPETNETNNTLHTGLAVKLPDLRVIQLTIPSANVTVGQPVSVSAVVENVSAVDVIHPFEVDIYQNLSGAPGISQVGNVTCNVDYLASKTTTTCAGIVMYLSTGTFKVWAQADTQNAIHEVYESNNIAGPATVTVAYPDLVIRTLRTSTTDAAVGQSVTLIATVHNAGGYLAGNLFTIDLYQNLPTPPGQTQVGNVTCTVNSLAAGASSSCYGSVSYNAPGTYQVWGQVDRANGDVESDETNNIAGPVMVTIH
jgi:subtilase family serine protease